MNKYVIDGISIDSIDLKCMVVSKGVKVDKEVYNRFSNEFRLNISPLTCNCIILSDGTIMQMTDMAFHLNYLNGMLSWDNLKLLKYASELTTPFAIKLVDDKAVLSHNGNFIDFVSFPPYSDFYLQKTSEKMTFIDNAVIQGLDWVAFQCLWVCEYASSGKPCEFCFSGAKFQSLAAKKKKQPLAVLAKNMAEIVDYAIKNVGCNSVQITGGSTFDGKSESEYIAQYLIEIDRITGISNLLGEILLYITPPSDTRIIDQYFSLGVSRIACSLELWDETKAKTVTPGKIEFSTRKRHLDILEYIAEKYGPAKAFSNFIIGIEEFETLKKGAQYLSERGIMPTASVWMPMGRPVCGTMKTPSVDYYKRTKELFAELYQKYQLEPPKSHGLNVCIERDIWNYSCS